MTLETNQTQTISSTTQIYSKRYAAFIHRKDGAIYRVGLYHKIGDKQLGSRILEYQPNLSSVPVDEKLEDLVELLNEVISCTKIS